MRPQSERVTQALALIGTPRAAGGLHTAYSAAKATGVSLSGIYRAQIRMRRATPTPAPDSR